MLFRIVALNDLSSACPKFVSRLDSTKDAARAAIPTPEEGLGAENYNAAVPRRGRRARRGSSALQELTGPVERTERQACFLERFRRAFLAVDHGEDQCDIATGIAHRFGRL